NIERPAEHLMGGLLDGLAVMRANPFADEVIGYADLQRVGLEVHPRGGIEPESKSLLSYFSRNCLHELQHLRVMASDAAQLRAPSNNQKSADCEKGAGNGRNATARLQTERLFT